MEETVRINPIAQRLTQLSDQWARFTADQAARVLVWQLTASELRVFDAFLEVESDERTAQHPSLFLALDTPFEVAAVHGRSLAEKLWAATVDGELDLRELGLPAGLRLPVPQKQELDRAYLIRCCQAFLDFFAVSGQLAIVLRARVCP